MNRLKETRVKLHMGQKEVAISLGVAQPTVSAWESGRKAPTVENLKALAELYRVSVDYLLGNDPVPQPSRKGIKIPVLGRVAAGIPIEAVEDVVDYEEITPEVAAQGDHFALVIQGDSMAPRICAGDVVVVRKQDCVENGDIAVVLINGQDATVKRFYASDFGIKLVALNPAYEPMVFSPEEVTGLPVTVVGKVVELRGKF